jgi:hypothetical protein
MPQRHRLAILPTGKMLKQRLENAVGAAIEIDR